VKKTAASAALLTKCILLHAYSHTTAAPNCASTNKNFLYIIEEAGVIVFLVIN